MTNVNILLVVENPSLRLIYKTQLTHDGYNVLEVNTSKDAYDLLQNKLISLMLLDFSLPDKFGLVFLENLRKESRYLKLPVILLTSLNDEVDFVKSAPLKINTYLIKDQTSPQKLSSCVQAALANTLTIP